MNGRKTTQSRIFRQCKFVLKVLFLFLKDTERSGEERGVNLRKVRERWMN